MKLRIKKWYFCINEHGIRGYEKMIRVALKSCRRETDLEPICIFHGKENDFIEELRRRGVRVINHTSSLIEAIASTKDDHQWKSFIATGAYLRVDIPIIEKDDDYVLYTDVDVIFCSGVAENLAEPKIFSCGTERIKDDWSFFNSGSMVINVENFRREHKAFIDYAGKRLRQFYPLGRGTYDQGALNAYFEGRWDRLPLEYNWKPYWGANDAACIVHFHGPKPAHIMKMASGDFEGIPKIYDIIFNSNKDSCIMYAEKYYAFGED